MLVPFRCSVSVSPVSTKQSLPCLFRFVAVFLSHLSKNTACHRFLFVRLTSSCLPHHPVLPIHVVLPFHAVLPLHVVLPFSCFSSSSGCSSWLFAASPFTLLFSCFLCFAFFSLPTTLSLYFALFLQPKLTDMPPMVSCLY